MARTDPRTSLALLILSVAAILVTRRTAVLAAECALLIAAAALLKTERPFGHMRVLFGSMLGLVFGIGLIFFDLGTSIQLVLRLFNFLALTFVFFQSVRPDDLSGALQKMGIPLGCTFILSAGMRYVPLIGRKLSSIRDAQQARGIDLRPRLRNLPHLAALLVPLIIQSFVLADDLALAMESRGFSRRHRSSRKNYRVQLWEYLLIIAAALALGLLVWWERV